MISNVLKSEKMDWVGGWGVQCLQALSLPDAMLLKKQSWLEPYRVVWLEPFLVPSRVFYVQTT